MSYINGCFLKEFKFNNGGSKIALSINQEFIKDIQEKLGNEKYLNIDIMERKSPDKNGNTHYMKLNEWKPEKSEVKKDNEDIPF